MRVAACIRKEFRDVFRSLGSHSLILTHALLEERATSQGTMLHPWVCEVYAPVAAHMWLFGTVITQVSGFRGHLIGINYIERIFVRYSCVELYEF